VTNTFIAEEEKMYCVGSFQATPISLGCR